MRYTFINAIVCSVPINEKCEVATPMVGYVLTDNSTNNTMTYSRQEAYELIKEHGAINVEAKSRVNEKNETCYYLKLKDKSFKITQFLVNHKDNKYACTKKYICAIIDTLKTYGYTEEQLEKNEEYFVLLNIYRS